MKGGLWLAIAGGLAAWPALATADVGATDEPQPVRASKGNGRISLGAFYGTPFGVTHYGGVGTLGFGLLTGVPGGRPVLCSLIVRDGHGSTLHGPGVRFTQVGIVPEMVVIDRLRVGLEGTIGRFAIHAVTGQQNLATVSLGFAVSASYDIARFSSTDSVYLAPRVSVDLVGENAAASTAALSLGYRWDTRHRSIR